MTANVAKQELQVNEWCGYVKSRVDTDGEKSNYFVHGFARRPSLWLVGHQERGVLLGSLG